MARKDLCIGFFDDWTLCLSRICRALAAPAENILRILKPCCLRGIINSINLNLFKSLHAPKPPLCKGRWHGEAVTEGLCGRHLFYCGSSAKSYCGNNPSVKNQKIFDSSLYTREPFLNRYILQKTDL